MTSQPTRLFWRRCRTCFRWFRITVWLLILLVLGTLVYLNQIGLPGFLKNPLIEKVRARGISLEFSRLRLRFYQGLVADNVRFGRAGERFGPQLTAAEVGLELNTRSLLRLRPQVDGLWLRQGRLLWPIVDTNQPARVLSIDNIYARLRFLPGDQWVLDDLTANFAGARFQFSGSVAHASAIRDWNFLRAEQPARPGELQDRLREIADLLDRIHFTASPKLNLQVRGDARDFQSFNARLSISAPGADTPWGGFSDARLGFRLIPAATNGLPTAIVTLAADDAQTRWVSASDFRLTVRAASLAVLTNLANADVNFEALSAQTPWAAATNMQVALHVAASPEQTNSVNADLTFLAAEVASQWGNGTNARFTAQWVHALTNVVPIDGHGQLRLDRAEGKWGSARQIELLGALAPADPPVEFRFPPSHKLDAWWTNLEPYALGLQVRLDDFQSPKLQAQALTCSAHWQAPELTLTNLHAELYHGLLEAGAALNASSRTLKFNFSSDVDPHKIQLLSEPARRFLADLSWKNFPLVLAEGKLTLPAWTNRQPDWQGEVQPTLQLQGRFDIQGGAAFRGVPVAAAQSHFSYSNLTWRLPDLTITRPEGNLYLQHEASERTRDFYWRVSSAIDIKAARPLLPTNAMDVLDLFALSRPPLIDAEVWGHANDAERLRLKGKVSMTNFTFRGETVSSFETTLQYTNNWLQFTGPHLLRATNEEMSATAMVVDFAGQKIYMTNGFSTADPAVVTRAIGPLVADTMEPYQFLRPPTVHAYGTIPLRNDNDADLYFKVKGGPFHWSKFHVAAISGDIHWSGQHLALTNVQTEFYGGKANGFASFAFHPGGETYYGFSLTTRDTQLGLLMADVAARTNRLEGLLSGSLLITKASTEDWRQSDGFGNLDLRDGLIWDIPLFGVFSDILNGLAPGLGTSRANAADCTFLITNGLIRTDNLEIRSPAMRLQYRGTVDLQGQVNARFEAGLLRDMWLVGPIVSTVFWPVTKLFEYKVTGSVEHPKTEPVYLIPKIILLPFHPIRTLKEMAPQGPSPPPANAPPAKSP